MERVCNKCGEIKLIEEFTKNFRRAYGYTNTCKICHNKILVEYNKTDKRKTQRKEYRRANIGKLKEVHKKYYYENSEKIKAKTRKWENENKDRVTARHKEYIISHAEELSVKHKLYRIKNADIIKGKKTIYYQTEHYKNVKKRQLQRLPTHYVISVLSDITGVDKDVIRQYPELIEAKRIQMKLKKLTNEKRNRTA